MDMDSMDASEMNMSFFSSSSTALFSSTWKPSTTGQYAGTCIFLIVLAVAYRCLLASKTLLEKRWLHEARQRRYVTVADKQPEAERIESDVDSKTAILTTNGVEERVKVVHSTGNTVQPWRFSVDLPRAAITTVISGVGFLIMLAIMTFNVGYFLSVLGGVFVGEVIAGRYMQAFPDHH